MNRKEFPKSVVEHVLIKCRRHCCVCDKWCGQKIEVHHIDDPSDNFEANALPVCFDCHAEIKSYNPSHPKGKKYTKKELIKLRQITFVKYSSIETSTIPSGTTEYGRGFHEGAEWANTQSAIQDIWRILSVHGDFALEILYYFQNGDTHTMMDDLLLSEYVDTGLSIRQSEGHVSVWTAGELLGLWGINADSEQFYLTQKGKIFRNLVHTNADLAHRFEQLEEFWRLHVVGVQSKKPNTSRDRRVLEGYSTGPMNALSSCVNCLTSISTAPSQLYFIKKVSSASTTLSSIADGTELLFSSTQIRDVRVDENKGYFVIDINLIK